MEQSAPSFLNSYALRLGMVLLLLATHATAAHCDSLHERFEQIRPEMVRKLKSNHVETQVSALESLRHYPVAEATRLAHGCFNAKSNVVRTAAYNTLHAMSQEPEVCDTLLMLAETSLKGRRNQEFVIPSLSVLLGSELPLTQVRARHFLNDKLAQSPQSLELFIGLADSLGTFGQESSIKPLVRLSQSNHYRQYYSVRRAVVQALTRTPPEASIDSLLDLMNTLEGEAKADAAIHLTRVTGQRFGLNTQAWLNWRQSQRAMVNQASFPGPISDPAKPVKGTVVRVNEVASEGGQYYGLNLYADRIVFVLDISGSMQGLRIAAAKRELSAAIQGLRSNVRFGIVIFSSSTAKWQSELVDANVVNKSRALTFIANINPYGWTSSYDALETAFSYDAEAIYFLTDGEPTTGKIVAPAEIVRQISQANHLRRISIYTIGIAPRGAGSPTDQFLQNLADQNWGAYRRTDG